MATEYGKLFERILEQLPVPAFFLASFILLASPEDFMVLLGLSDFRNETREWTGIVFLLSGSAILVKVALKMPLSPPFERLLWHILLRLRLRRLRNIDMETSYVIAMFYRAHLGFREFDSVNSDTSDIELQKLKDLNVIEVRYMRNGYHPIYQLRPWVKRMITENDEIKQKFST